MIKFSILTVCFNSEKYIAHCIKSVLNQSYENFEYILIDGNSTDRTVEIIKSFEDPRIKLISEPDDGIYDAMMKGINISKGENVHLLNSDDYYIDENVLENWANVKFYFDILHGPLVKINESEQIQSYIGNKTAHLNFPTLSPMNHPTCLVKKDVFLKHGFDLRLKSASDFLWMINILRDNSTKVIYYNKLTVCFRTVGQTSNNWFPPVKEIYYVLKKANYRYDIIIYSILYRVLRNFIRKIF